MLTRLAIWILLSSAAFGATYYVSPTGSDSDPGTIEQPWLTPKQASVSPGDTVYFRGGTYTNRITLSQSGTPAARITYTAYSNEVPTLYYTNHSLTGFKINCDNVTVSKITVRGSCLAGMDIDGYAGHATNNIIDSCDVADSWNIGIAINALGGGVARSNIIRNCRVFNVSTKNWPRAVTNGWGGGISLNKGVFDGCLVENCLGYFIHGEGFLLSNGNGCTVRNCIIADSYRYSMYADGDNNVFEGNVTFCSRDGLAENGGETSGAWALITMENQSLDTNAIGVRGCRFINNLIVNGNGGITIENFESPYTNYAFSDILFANNTCIGANSSAVSIDSDVGAPTGASYNNLHILNNLFLPSPLYANGYYWTSIHDPDYPIDLGNNIYCYSGAIDLNWSGTHVSPPAGLATWETLSGETTNGARASVWIGQTNQVELLIPNMLASAYAMPRLWQTNGGAAADIDVDALFADLSNASNVIRSLRLQLSTPFRPYANATNVVLTAGRALASWTWVDDYGATNTVDGPLAFDMTGSARGTIPAVGALEPTYRYTHTHGSGTLGSSTR